MKNYSFIPWVKEEGVFVATKGQKFRAKIGMSYRMDFFPKSMMKQMSELTNKEFEKKWKVMKEKGMVKEAYVKYDKVGKMIDVCSQLFKEERENE